MRQEQGTVIDKLVNLIQKLQSKRETGQLTSRHGDGIATEEGIIVFANGKITEARVGRRTGSEALNKLSTWENCLCWFVLSIDNTMEPHTHDSLDVHTEISITTQTNTSPLVLFPPSGKRTDPLEEDRWTERSVSPPVPEVPYPVIPLQPALSKIERLGLSRAHRRFFLLIDGRRSVPDLIRLTGREKDYVYQILRDLERAMLIRISDEMPQKER